ncbi:MAG: MFS transporter [Acidobacteria bacterium]|nr:MFS transporter [Acidobacteriota bacterium]
MGQENYAVKTQSSQPEKVSEVAGPEKFTGGNLRWVVCALLFFSTTINYMDRQVISYLKEFFSSPTAAGGFGWSNQDFSYLTSAFTGFYAAATVLAGWLIDRIGTKLGLALSLVFWSICGIANAFVGPLLRMHIIVRSAFAVGEAGNFPASIKTVAEWFPKRERALATAIFNAGTNGGAMVAALVVPAIMVHFGDGTGWRMAFIITGAMGFTWLVFWFWLYNPPFQHAKVSKAELDYIRVDDEPSAAPADDGVKVSWVKLFRYRQLWSFVAGKFMTDGVWWFYLFWLPDYLNKQFHMTKGQVMLPTFIVYGVAIVGSIYGGSIPKKLIERGMSVYQARMTTMFIIACFPLLVLLTQFFGDVGRFGAAAAALAVAMIAVGATAHQAWSANLFTTVSDMFPKANIASVIGIGTMAGGIGGVVVQLLAGKLNDTFLKAPQTAYLIMFGLCGLSYLTAWVLMKILVPEHRPITRF